MKEFLNALLYTTIGGIIVAFFTYWLSSNSSADLRVELEDIRLPRHFTNAITSAHFPIPNLPERPKISSLAVERQVDEYLAQVNQALKQLTTARESRIGYNENITNFTIENQANVRSKEIELFIPNLEIALLIRGNNKEQVIEKSTYPIRISFLDPEEKIQITALTRGLFFEIDQARVLHDGKKVTIKRARENFERDHFGIRRLISRTSPVSDFVILIITMFCLVVIGGLVKYLIIWENFPALAKGITKSEVARTIKLLKEVEKLYPEKLPDNWPGLQK